MKLHPNHVLATAAVVVIAAFAEFSGTPVASAEATPSDPSVPPASTVLSARDPREGNVQDMTY